MASEEPTMASEEPTMASEEPTMASEDDSSKRRQRFEATNEQLRKHGLATLDLEGRKTEPAPAAADEQMLLAERLGLDVLAWHAIRGNRGTILGLEVDQRTFGTLQRRFAAAGGGEEAVLTALLRKYAKTRLAAQNCRLGAGKL